MGKPSSPAAPDYAGAAAAQGDANLTASQYEAGVNRPDEYGPTGSRTWSIRNGADPKNPKPGDYVLNTELSPEQQGLYQSETDISQNFLDTAQAGLGRVSSALEQPFDLSGMQPVGTVGAGGVPVTQGPQTPNLSTQIDTSGLAALPTDAAGTRQAVTQAIIDRARPEMERNAQAARTRSIVTGGDAGSEGYKNVEQQIGRNENDMILGAINQGDTAAAREIASQLALRGQGYGERATEAGFGNEALSQMFGQGLEKGGFENSAAGQEFAQLLQGTGFDNQARQQQIQDLLLQRQLPINEINALRTGSQVSMPQFQAYGGVNTQAAPVMDAALAQGNYDLGQYQSEMGGYNGLLGSAATAAAVFF
jgi:hypothetical protein